MSEILTRRTCLKLISSNDLETIHELHSLPEVDAYNTLGLPRNIEETQSIIQPWIVANKKNPKLNYTFKIEHLNDQAFIGLFGLKLWHSKHKRGEVWYKIHPKFWRNGYATEALSEVLNFGFDTLNLHRIQAGCAVDNIGSIKVLEKVGMIREGRGRQVLPLKNGWSDNYEYAILDSDPRA